MFEHPLMAPFLALYTMSTYVFQVYRAFPYIHLTGERGSGKTTVLDVLKPLVFNGLQIVNPTQAVLFRMVENSSPTLLIDEAERFRGKEADKSPIMEVLRSGYRCGGVVMRCKPPHFQEILEYRTYGPKMFASINEIDPVLRDRSILIRMRRKTKKDRAVAYIDDAKNTGYATRLRDACYLFALQYAPGLRAEYETGCVKVPGLEDMDGRVRELYTPIMNLACLIDRQRGDEEFGLSLTMRDVAEHCLQAKAEEDHIDDDDFDIVLKFRELVGKGAFEPVKEENGTIYFETETVYLKILEGMKSEKISKTRLSRALKRNGIRCEPFYHEGATRRGYLVDAKPVPPRAGGKPLATEEAFKQKCKVETGETEVHE